MDQTLRINSIYLFLLHQLIYLPCGIINLKSSKISKKKKKDKIFSCKSWGKRRVASSYIILLVFYVFVMLFLFVSFWIKVKHIFCIIRIIITMVLYYIFCL
jgi:hypothetical protein